METDSVFVQCPNCGHGLNIPAQYRGQQGGCKHCGGIFTVPGAPAPPGNELADIGVAGITVEEIAPRAAPVQSSEAGGAETGKWRKPPVVIGGAALLCVCCLAVAVIAWRYTASGPRVYLSPLDTYYFHEVCPRAASLGITEDSPTYSERQARDAGYQPIPPELREQPISRRQAAWLRKRNQDAEDPLEEGAWTPAQVLVLTGALLFLVILGVIAKVQVEPHRVQEPDPSNRFNNDGCSFWAALVFCPPVALVWALLMDRNHPRKGLNIARAAIVFPFVSWFLYNMLWGFASAAYNAFQ